MKIRFEAYLLQVLHGFNHFLHALVAIALVMASLMVVWEFSVAVMHSFEKNDLAHGFLQALGSLLLSGRFQALLLPKSTMYRPACFMWRCLSK